MERRVGRTWVIPGANRVAATHAPLFSFDVEVVTGNVHMLEADAFRCPLPADRTCRPACVVLNQYTNLLNVGLRYLVTRGTWEPPYKPPSN